MVGSPVELLCNVMEEDERRIYVRSYKFLDDADNEPWL